MDLLPHVHQCLALVASVLKRCWQIRNPEHKELSCLEVVTAIHYTFCYRQSKTAPLGLTGCTYDAPHFVVLLVLSFTLFSSVELVYETMALYVYYISVEANSATSSRKSKPFTPLLRHRSCCLWDLMVCIQPKSSAKIRCYNSNCSDGLMIEMLSG